VRGYASGETYLDIGTVNGYHAAQDFLRGRARLQDTVPRTA